VPKAAKPTLSGLENQVMRVVWQQGRVTADLVRTALEPAQTLKDSTIRTILRRLEQKGYVAHKVEGRTYVYSPTVASRNVAVEAVRGIIQRLCNGSVEDLLLGMVDREMVSPETLRNLANRIAASEKAAPVKSTSERRRSQRSPKR